MIKGVWNMSKIKSIVKIITHMATCVFLCVCMSKMHKMQQAHLAQRSDLHRKAAQYLRVNFARGCEMHYVGSVVDGGVMYTFDCYDSEIPDSRVLRCTARGECFTVGE